MNLHEIPNEIHRLEHDLTQDLKEALKEPLVDVESRGFGCAFGRGFGGTTSKEEK